MRSAVKKNSAGKKAFLSLAEVQTYLGIKSRKTILKYIQKGDLAAYKIGGTRWRVARHDVAAFLENQFSAPSRKRLALEVGA